MTKVEIKEDVGRVTLVLHSDRVCQTAYYHVFIQVRLSLENTTFRCPRSRRRGMCPTKYTLEGNEQYRSRSLVNADCDCSHYVTVSNMVDTRKFVSLK
jgi:hypothetical protein